MYSQVFCLFKKHCKLNVLFSFIYQFLLLICKNTVGFFILTWYPEILWIQWFVYQVCCGLFKIFSLLKKKFSENRVNSSIQILMPFVYFSLFIVISSRATGITTNKSGKSEYLPCSWSCCCCCCCYVASVVSDPQRPHGLQPFRLLHPWDFPGKSTGVGCHCLLCHSLLVNLKHKSGK